MHPLNPTSWHTPPRGSLRLTRTTALADRIARHILAGWNEFAS